MFRLQVLLIALMHISSLIFYLNLSIICLGCKKKKKFLQCCQISSFLMSIWI